jgi:hypothetical protein
VRTLDEVGSLVWSATGGDPDLAADHLALTGERRVLPSCFDVTGFAAAAVGAAALGVARLAAARRGDGAVPAVAVDTREASAAFVCEHLFAPVGWELPDIWDPIAGDYETADGWIKLHTNYASHKAAALAALGLGAGAKRADVAAAVAERRGDDLEQGVVDAGGCAAALRTAETWATHPHGSVAVAEPAIRSVAADGVLDLAPITGHRQPLHGVKVLDLTRVIAGPVCTRFLAAHGATVLRLDPPGFAEVAALLPETTAGKRTAWLDLADPRRRARFVELLAEADVLVHGLRPGAMEAHGLGDDAIRSINPGLVTARLDAYGWEGPWAGRRGFDSLVQMSCGIAAAGMAAAGASKPTPLPAQALDHGAGHLLAAAVASALADGRPADVRASLVGVANLLLSLPDPDGMAAPKPTWGPADRVERDTEWGLATAAPIPGTIAGCPTFLDLPSGPLGRHRPAFSS